VNALRSFQRQSCNPHAMTRLGNGPPEDHVLSADEAGDA